MALSGKVETEIEIQATAATFYKLLRKDMRQVPSMSKERLHGSKMLEGDWGNVGSVKYWEYSIEGRRASAKAKLEAVDDENKSFTYSLYDEEISENYKSLKITLHVIDREHGGLVKWTVEYEKLKENITAASPESYLDFTTKVTQDIDAHLVKA